MTATPFEANGNSAWTTLAAERAFYDTLAASTGRLAVQTIGTSFGGRNIDLVRIGASTPPAPRSAAGALFITGCPHGDEPSGREACMALARDLAETSDPSLLAYLAEHPVYMIPTNNPDGFASLQRPNGAGDDLNRDHILLANPETVLVATAIRDLSPDIHLDLHEADQSGSAEMQLLWPTNPNVDTALRDAAQALVTALQAAGTAGGFTNALYGVGGEGPEIGRNTAGLRHTLGILFETLNRNGNTRARRVTTHRAFIGYAIDYHQANAAAIAAVREGARRRKEAEAITQSRPFDLGGTLVSPPATNYQLTATQQTSASTQLQAFGVMVENGAVWCHQAAQPVIPYLLDPSAPQRAAAGTRAFTACYPHRLEWWDDHRWRETIALLPDGSAAAPTAQ